MNVLVVAPHADDEILGVGGTIAKYIDEGHDVYVCIVTSGHHSMYSKNYLEQIRTETESAHQYLNIKKTYFLDFPAVLISEVPKYEINEKISNVIDEVKPEVVFLPHFGDMHLDHLLVSQSTMVAVRPIKEHKVLEVYSYEVLSETEWNIPHVRNVFTPNTYVDISLYIDKKLNAMSFFKTQLKAFPHPRSLEAIEALAKLRGSTINTDYAEAFCLIRRIII